MAARRKSRVGKLKPWSVLAAPPERDPREVWSEVGSDLGLELAMLVRQVRLVASAAPEQRGALFPSSPGRHVHQRRRLAMHEAPRRLRPPLRLLMRLTGRRPPEDREVCTACLSIATWCAANGMRFMAVHFAEAAAAIRHKDASVAYAAARLNRRFGAAWRAEVYYERAVRFAQRSQKWRIFARAHMGLAKLLLEAGRPALALKHYRIAARSARDQGEYALAAGIYHDLALLYLRRDRAERALDMALLASGTYPRSHPRLLEAAHDLAVVLMASGRDGAAVEVLTRLARKDLGAEVRVQVRGTLAKAAGKIADVDAYLEAAAHVLAFLQHAPRAAPLALVNVAAGAWALGERRHAETYVLRGMRLAASAGQSGVEGQGAELLTQIRDGAAPPSPKLAEGELDARLAPILSALEREEETRGRKPD